MPELLRHTELAAVATSLPPPGAVLDPATARFVEQATEEAAALGRAEGEALGRAAAHDEVASMVGSVTAAIGAVRAELAEQRAAATAADLDLAQQLAAAVLGRTPPDDATTILTRVRTALEALDEEPLQVHLHPDDHAVLASELEGCVQVTADPSIERGDALVQGRTCGAELLRSAMLDAAVAAVQEAEL